MNLLLLLNIFPILEPILVFTPIYTAYLVVKGCKLLRFSEGENTQSIIVLVILNICTPLVIGYLLSILLILYLTRKFEGFSKETSNSIVFILSSITIYSLPSIIFVLIGYFI